MNNCNNNINNSSGDVMSWVIVIICLVAFWPLGLVLLLRKISFNAKKNASAFSSNKPGQASSAQYRQTTGSQGAYNQPQQSNRPGQASGQYRQPGPSQQGYRPAGTAQQAYTSYDAPRSRAPKAQAPHAQQGSYYAQANQSAQACQAPQATRRNDAGKKPKKVKEKKQNGKGLASFLTFLGIFFSMIGVTCVAAGISSAASSGFDTGVLATIWAGIFFCLGGVVSFVSRIGIKERIRKCNKYDAIMGDRQVMSVSDMTNACGTAPKKLRKDLIYLADNGYFGESAYFDIGLDSLCLSSEAAENARTEAKRSAETPADKPVGSENQYVAVINELHMLCSRTIDPTICAKIQRIEELTAKIFKIVEDKPEKMPQIRRFMNYYLPTTLKLLHSYETLEKQGISGENIMSAKQDIERVLETLATGYEQQLDNLFKSDKLDISSDINVLENMMEQDGLTNDGNILKTAGGN